MKIVNAGYEFITPINGKIILERIEQIARVCYKSEQKAKEGSAEKMVAALIRNGNEAMLEHCSFTVKFIVDRGISHEIVRHRMASYAQESTRYCNYIKEDFGSEITVIEPCYLEKTQRRITFGNLLALTQRTHTLTCWTLVVLLNKQGRFCHIVLKLKFA